MRILIVEEESMLAQSMKAILEVKGFSVETVGNGDDGFRYALRGIYDVLILSGTAPGMDSFYIVQKVRQKHCAVPIIMLMALCDIEKRIRGLNAGADYYLEKPFDSGELLACINALLRRQNGHRNALTYGNTELNLDTCMLACGEKQIRLSAREFDVMRFMMQSRDNVVPKERILARVWGADSGAVDNHVEVYVRFLRKKLSSIGSDIQIIALRRLGYHLEINK